MNSQGDKGRFIAFEGGEGVGKSTQTAMLADALRRRGHDVRTTREPGGTKGAEAIRELLLHPPGDGWEGRAEALLFAAARSDHVERLIRPAIDAGSWVICDRFVGSSRAYQGGAGGLGDDAIIDLHRFGSLDLRPDLTILLTVDENESRQRLARRDGGESDAIGGRDADYHRAVTDAFAAIARREPERWRCIDTVEAPAIVHDRVMAAITPLFGQGEA